MLDADASRWAARPRPVPDAGVAGFFAEADLVKAWVLQLIAGLPLDRAATVDLRALAELGPELCGAVVAALASDAELDRLHAGGDLAALVSRLGRLTGAEGPAAVAGAVEALRVALWAELRAELRRPSAELVGAIAERLAHVCAVLAQTALAPQGVGLGAPAAAPEPAGEALRAWRAIPDGPSGRPDAWTAAVRHGLQSADAGVVSVLAVDVDEAERLLGADADGEVARALARIERVLTAAIENDGELTVVAPGRYGATLPGLDGPAARAVGERLAAAVGIGAAPRGVALRASVGLASSPADGTEAATLIACAEERAVTARASGVTLA